MLVLALDTSSAVAVALVGDGAPLAVRTSPEQRRHAELLAPLVAEALAEAGLTARELDAVAVGTGPAPFTGLRAGLVTARALGFAVGRPVLGVGSLDVLAAQAYAAGAEGELLVAADARRHEVYLGRFRADAEHADVVALELDVVRAEDVRRGDETAVVGPAAALVAETTGLPAGGPQALDPVLLAALATSRAARGVPTPTEPLYLRRPDAVPPGARKRATG